MSQNISLLGATYSAVPAVNLPKSGGGTATFTDVTDTTAAAADVATGKYFYTSAGVRTEGTNSGGGGSGIATLLKSTSLGTMSTNGTSAADSGKSVTVTGINGYHALIVETAVDSVTNNRHMGTTRWIALAGTTNSDTVSGATVANATWNARISSSAVKTTRASTTAYGIYPNSCTITTTSNGTATIPLYWRYNSTQTGTINGSYTTRVYGVKLL